MLAQLAPVKGVLYLHLFENEAIVCAKTTNEYFQYLFASWDYPRTTLAKNCQIQLQSMYGTDLRRLYFIRSSRSIGLNFRLNWPAMAGTYRHTLQKNLMST
jgi:hypothetical protein